MSGGSVTLPVVLLPINEQILFVACPILFVVCILYALMQVYADGARAQDESCIVETGCGLSIRDPVISSSWEERKILFPADSSEVSDCPSPCTSRSVAHSRKKQPPRSDRATPG